MELRELERYRTNLFITNVLYFSSGSLNSIHAALARYHISLAFVCVYHVNGLRHILGALLKDNPVLSPSSTAKRLNRLSSRVVTRCACCCGCGVGWRRRDEAADDAAEGQDELVNAASSSAAATSAPPYSSVVSAPPAR